MTCRSIKQQLNCDESSDDEHGNYFDSVTDSESENEIDILTWVEDMPQRRIEDGSNIECYQKQSNEEYRYDKDDQYGKDAQYDVEQYNAEEYSGNQYNEDAQYGTEDEEEKVHVEGVGTSRNMRKDQRVKLTNSK